ncbi:hypothetical protein M9458_056691, partial [Cirrhinus mrigala]
MCSEERKSLSHVTYSRQETGGTAGIKTEIHDVYSCRGSLYSHHSNPYHSEFSDEVKLTVS